MTTTLNRPAPEAPGGEPTSLLDRAALASLESLVVQYGDRTNPEERAGQIASASWVYARAWMAERSRLTFLPKLLRIAPTDAAETLSDVWPVIAELAAIPLDQPIDMFAVLGLIRRAQRMMERRGMLLARVGPDAAVGAVLDGSFLHQDDAEGGGK